MNLNTLAGLCSWLNKNNLRDSIMTVKERLRNLVSKFKTEQEIDTAAVERAKRVIEAAKREAKKKLS